MDGEGIEAAGMYVVDGFSHPGGVSGQRSKRVLLKAGPLKNIDVWGEKYRSDDLSMGFARLVWPCIDLLG